MTGDIPWNWHWSSDKELFLLFCVAYGENNWLWLGGEILQERRKCKNVGRNLYVLINAGKASVTGSAYRGAEFTRGCYCAGISAHFLWVLRHLILFSLGSEAFELNFTAHWGIWAHFQWVLRHLRSISLHTEAFELIFSETDPKCLSAQWKWAEMPAQ